MKTIHDYLNDPRISNDRDMAEALEPVREIHAIRLKIQDEIAGMTLPEKVKFLNNEAEVFLASIGKSLCYDLAGNGKLEPISVKCQ